MDDLYTRIDAGKCVSHSHEATAMSSTIEPLRKNPYMYVPLRTPYTSNPQFWCPYVETQQRMFQETGFELFRGVPYGALRNLPKHRKNSLASTTSRSMLFRVEPRQKVETRPSMATATAVAAACYQDCPWFRVEELGTLFNVSVGTLHVMFPHVKHICGSSTEKCATR